MITRCGDPCHDAARRSTASSGTGASVNRSTSIARRRMSTTTSPSDGARSTHAAARARSGADRATPAPSSPRFEHPPDPRPPVGAGDQMTFPLDLVGCGDGGARAGDDVLTPVVVSIATDASSGWRNTTTGTPRSSCCSSITAACSGRLQRRQHVDVGQRRTKHRDSVALPAPPQPTPAAPRPGRHRCGHRWSRAATPATPPHRAGGRRSPPAASSIAYSGLPPARSTTPGQLVVRKPNAGHGVDTSLQRHQPENRPARCA